MTQIASNLMTEINVFQMFLLILFKAMESSLFAPEIRDQTCRHASFTLAPAVVLAVISSPLTVIIFNKDFDLILKESHASFIRFLDTSFSNLCHTTPPVTVHKLGFSPFVPNASVNPERKDFKKTPLIENLNYSLMS